MTITAAMLDEEVAKNLALAAHVSSTIVLTGRRQFDRFVLSASADAARTLTLERLCHESVNAHVTWVYEPAKRHVLLSRAAQDVDIKTSLPTQLGAEKELPLIDVLEAFGSLVSSETTTRFLLLVNAGLLVEDTTAPRDADFRTVQAIVRFSRIADRQHLLILRAGKTTELPNAILSSPSVKSVHIPAASRDVRVAYARLRAEELARRCDVPAASLATTLSDATEEWTVDQLDALLQTAESQAISSVNDLEELSRAVRVGTTHSPWAGERIRTAISQAEGDLTKRVVGQPKAIDAVISALRKAVVGLSTAHQNQGSQTPRAVFFFAGPTGTGKTELAKAIGQLVFGQEQLLRFDCGELRQEHAVARLIGAPPGYVGFDRGGELTEGIRAKPNSVVLFDEIEKAHPRLLDTLLGVLDDGRLTSGQGETAYFGQAVLIFTSNLGIYEQTASGDGLVVRRPRFGYDTTFDVIERTVRDAIRDEFVTGLGRPELLGRFGGAESIVVFDYLRDIDRVCRKFVSNIAANCERLHGVNLEVDDDIIARIVQNTQARADALVLGGRGLKPELDRALTNPLADYLFERPTSRGRLRAQAHARGTSFIAM